MRILVVDDDYVSRVKLAAILQVYGQCDNAPNAAIAIELFKEAHKELVPYDIVAIDIEMPGISGSEAVVKFREIEAALEVGKGKTVKVIMVTAHKAIRDVTSSYYSGCDAYLIKPVTVDGVKAVFVELGIPFIG